MKIIFDPSNIGLDEPEMYDELSLDEVREWSLDKVRKWSLDEVRKWCLDEPKV